MVQIGNLKDGHRFMNHVGAFGIELNQGQGSVRTRGLLLFQKTIKATDGVVLDVSH